METRPKDDSTARYVNEPGLYRLLGKSEMKKAEEFQDWLYEVVLPSIRKTGSYSLPCAITQPAASALNNLEWQGKREVARQLTKAKSQTVHTVTRGQAKGVYGKVNAALTKSVAGRAPEVLRALHGFKDTPRNYMPESMLGLLAYGEQAVNNELLRKQKEVGRFLTEAEVARTAWQVTDKISGMCKDTGGFTVPLLTGCPAPVGQKQKAIGCKLLQSNKQQKLISCK